MFGEEQLPIAGLIAVHNDIEDPIVALDQGWLDTELLSNFGRQTGGPRKVVSTCAVRNLNFHRCSRLATLESGIQGIGVPWPAAICRGPCHIESARRISHRARAGWQPLGLDSMLGNSMAAGTAPPDGQRPELRASDARRPGQIRSGDRESRTANCELEHDLTGHHVDRVEHFARRPEYFSNVRINQ